eukprot:TRINITY_DN11647_c0_g1_i2.p1 TRINITY_DN11647_c0_g1~~TRINITY_DN11647_c0_g1_i2.p1  ORF type:complete len:235 (+),score=37.67 TRINITY_DN11647_c0_g1_i2:303-1007(+)
MKDGDTVVVGRTGGVVEVFSFRERTSVQILQHQHEVVCLQETTNRGLISGSVDGTILLWNSNSNGTNKNKFLPNSHNIGVLSHKLTALLSLKSSKLVSCSSDGIIYLWDVSSQNRAATQLLLGKHKKEVTTIVEASAGILVSGSVDRTIHVWSEMQMCLLRSVTAPIPIRKLIITRTGSLLCCSDADLYISNTSLSAKTLVLKCCWVLAGQGKAKELKGLLPIELYELILQLEV